MDETTQPTDDLAANPRRLNPRLAILAIVLLVLAIVILTPPLINVQRLQQRIANDMSKSLGRPVHLNGVKLHILPIPGFTLSNLVVSEDPAFGSEPTIVAGTVEVHVRLRSLWTRRVEIARIQFTDPSLNLVRNPDGRWNIESLLMHATSLDTASTPANPTKTTGRFPYIEATGARINLKLGDEKMPFSLTDADFSLWLPSAQQWHVQLKAHPARTDNNLSDPGLIRLDGTMQRAPSWSTVPVDLHASWHDAPLGEATRLLTGTDAGWRGTVEVDAAIQGTLGASAVTTNITFNDLRRADFVPLHPLDLAITCTAQAALANATMETANCDLPDGAPQPAHLQASSIDLRTGGTAKLSLDADAVPLAWVFNWFKILSPHTPQEVDPPGNVAAHFTRTAGNPWTGEATATLPSPEPENTTPLSFQWKTETTSVPCPQTLALAPTTVAFSPTSTLTFSGDLSRCGYTYRTTGLSTATQLQTLGTNLPTLSESTTSLLPTATTPTHIDLTCTRTWGDPQTCLSSPPTSAKPHNPHIPNRK